jgi:endoglucanase
MAIPPLLDELLRAPGPPGAEDAVAAIVRREAVALGAEVEGDVLGSTLARVRGTDGRRTLALIAHVDQVGVTITRLDGDGRAHVAPLGTWHPRNAVARRFRVLTKAGEVAAVAVRVGDEGDPSWDTMRLDLGVDGPEAAGALVDPGDAAVLVGEPVPLAGGRLVSAALDDRLGVYAALETLRRVAAEPAAWDVVLLASVQEEGGKHAGAAAATTRLRPDVAVVVECTYASDAPSGPAPWGEVPLGGGPSVFRGPVVHPAVVAGLERAAAAADVALSFEAGRETWSDADDVFVAAGGTPTGLVSIPVRHMHTASEIAQLSDVAGATDVLEAYARALSPDASFLR